jgi:hypothetical protein
MVVLSKIIAEDIETAIEKRVGQGFFNELGACRAECVNQCPLIEYNE